MRVAATAATPAASRTPTHDSAIARAIVSLPLTRRRQVEPGARPTGSSLLARFESNPATAAVAHCSLVDELDPRAFERADQFHQGFHLPPDHLFARFHPLNRR